MINKLYLVYKKLPKLYWVLSSLPLLISMTILRYLPKEVPLHYGLNANVDRYGSKYEILILPIISILIALLLPYLSLKNPKYDILTKTNKIVNYSQFIIFNLLNGIILYNAYNVTTTISTEPGKYILVPAQIIFIIMGNYMPKTTPNPVFGIKVKATLKDEEVWHKTHKLGGKLWVVSGIIMLVSVFWFSYDFAIYVTLVGLFIDIIIPIVYANKLYKLKHNN